MEWITCETCEEEFRVVSSSHELVQYCPYCGNDIIVELEDDED